MNIEPWKPLQRTQVFKKYSRAIDRVDFQLPDGSEADFYIKAESSAAAVVALTKDQQVILARQYRPGPQQVLTELPGGMIEPDQEPTAAIKREFLEETGYTGTFQYIGNCLDDAYSTMDRACFVATDCYKVAESQLTSTEQIEVVLLPISEFRQLLRSGRMTDVEVGYMGLDYLQKL